MGQFSSGARTPSGRAFLLALLPCGAIAIACGSSSSGADDNISTQNADAGSTDDTDSGTTISPTDAGTTKKKDSGTTETTTPGYPATHYPLPPVTYNGGNILDAVSIVTITFPNDALETTIQDFDDTITTTAWWSAVTAGYCDARKKCIGPGSGGGHVSMTSAPAGTYTDSSSNGASSLKTFIQDEVANGTFPAPTANTLYALYFPASTKITLDNAASCDTFGGYHDAVTINGSQVAYAVLPRCDPSQDLLTFAASHEIIEAATDPFLNSNSSSYYAYGSLTDAWDYIPSGGEVGDRCVSLFNDGSDAYQEGSYVVQRIWNNTSAAGSHAPCVPAPSTPYFNVAPNNGDVIDCAVGATVTVALTAFSDFPMSGPFDVQTQEVTQILGGQNVLTLSLDKSSVTNGDAVQLTVTMNSSPSQGAAAFVLESTSGSTTNIWPFLVQPPQ